MSRNIRESAYNHRKTRFIKYNMISDVNSIKGPIKTKIQLVMSVITNKETFVAFGKNQIFWFFLFS